MPRRQGWSGTPVTMNETGKRRWKVALAVFIALVAIVSIFTWYELFRVVPQDDSILRNPETKFKYGSLGAEGDRGIPYLVWMVLPRIFPDLMPGPGGYKSFGLVWEDGNEMPVGFAK